MTVETLITNALSTANTRSNTAFDKLVDSLIAWTGSPQYTQLVQLLGREPISSIRDPLQFGYGDGIGSVESAIGIDDWDIVTESVEGNSLRSEAIARITEIKNDFFNKAEDLLGEVVGSGLDVDISDITTAQYSFVAKTYADFANEIAAIEHEELRAKRKIISALAGQGYKYLPGHAADTFNEQRLETSDRTAALMRDTIRQRAQNELSQYEGLTSAILSALGDVTNARIAMLTEAKRYAISVAKGVEFAIDETYYPTLAQLKYENLRINEIKVDSAIKADAMSSFNRYVNTQSRADEMIRRYKDFVLGTNREDRAESDMKQYFDAQESAVKAGINALEWLGKIAAAAESAANVVVSAGVTSFE